ncbi:hypothetical protein BJ742DRAFT_769170 [Cladochytrium replicatum]|nr:hypothetical protein BJ742DRAFT_769170 [Cladochytrium replicatum]
MTMDSITLAVSRASSHDTNETESDSMSHRNSLRLGKRPSLFEGAAAPDDPFNDSYSSATVDTTSSPPRPTITVDAESTLDRRASLISVPEALPVELISFVDAPSSHSYLTSPLRPPNSTYGPAAPHSAPLSQQAISRQNQNNSNSHRTNWAHQVLLQQRDEKEETLAKRSAGVALRMNAGTASPADSLTIPGLGTAAAAAAVEGQKGSNGLQNLRTARSVPDVALQALVMAQSTAFADLQPPPSYDAAEHNANSANIEKAVGSSRSERSGGSSSLSGPNGPLQYPLNDDRTYHEKRTMDGGMPRIHQPLSAVPRDVFAGRGSGAGTLLREGDADRHIHRTAADRVRASIHSTSNSSDGDFDDEDNVLAGSKRKKKESKSDSRKYTAKLLASSKGLEKSKGCRRKWFGFVKDGNFLPSKWQRRMGWLVLFGMVVMCLLVGMAIGIRYSLAMSEAKDAKPSGTPPNFKVAPKSQYVLSDVVADFCNQCNDFNSWCVCVNDPSSASNQTSTALIDSRTITLSPLSPPLHSATTKMQKMRRDGPAVPAVSVSFVRKGLPPVPTSRRPETIHNDPTPTPTPGDHNTFTHRKEDHTTSSAVRPHSQPHPRTSSSTTTSTIVQPDSEKQVDAVSMWCWCKPKQSPCTSSTRTPTSPN